MRRIPIAPVLQMRLVAKAHVASNRRLSAVRRTTFTPTGAALAGPSAARQESGE